MADYLTTDTELTSIANAIRTKGGTSASLTYPAGFVSAIENIPSGGVPVSNVTLTMSGMNIGYFYTDKDMAVQTLTAGFLFNVKIPSGTLIVAYSTNGSAIAAPSRTTGVTEISTGVTNPTFRVFSVN